MDEERQKYDNDSREACKYGGNCYQKNPKHRLKFKHPPKDNSSTVTKKRAREDETHDNAEKKLRCQEEAGLEPTDSGNEIPRETTLTDDSNTEDDLPSSPQDIKESIRQKFLVEMPEDFYSFWEFCKTMDFKHPEDAFKKVDLHLVGPFDVLSGKISNRTVTQAFQYLCHSRYHYDPPEFQTLIRGDDNTQYHIGYFRDSPDEMPALVAFNEPTKGCLFKVLGENLFAALNSFLTDYLVNTKDQHLNDMQESLKRWAKKHKFSLEKQTSRMMARDKRVVTKCFHGLGLVVPYDKKTEVGYRPLPETNANLRRILRTIVECKTEADRDKKFDTLQEIITLIQFANDECDYGMGLEFAVNLFCFGHSHFHRTILNLLPLAYDLLHRPQFGQIIKAHLKVRNKDKAFGAVPLKK